MVHWLIYTIGVVLIVCAAIIGVASTPWFRHFLQHRIQATLSQVTGGKVEIIGMKFRPLDLRVSARRLIIRGLEKNAKEPLFSAQDVVVSASPDSLLQLRLVLRILQWQRAELRVRTYPDGSTNLPGTTVSPGQGQALAKLLDLGIERMTLSHTTLYWNNQRVPLQVVAHNVAIRLHVSQNHHYLGTVASSEAVFSWKDKTSPRLSFATTFKLSTNRVQISALSWQIGNLRGHLTGTFHWTPQLAGDFEFRTNGGLQEFAQAFNIHQLESGYLYLDGKGTYSEKGFSVKGRMQARELRLKVPKFKPGVLSLASDYAFTRRQLMLTNLSFAGLNARAQGEATVTLANYLPQVALHGRFENLSLSTLMQAAPALASNLGIFHPRALMDGILDASWQGPSKWHSQFDLQFHQPAQQSPKGLPLSGQAQGSIDVSRQVLLTVKSAHLSTPHSSLETQGTMGTSQSSLTFKFLTTDFGEWHPLAQLLIKTRNPLPITLHSQAVFKGNVSGTLSSPRIEGDVALGSFNYGGWSWDSFQAGVTMSPSLAIIRSGRVKIGPNSLTLDAEASLFDWKLEPYSVVRLQATAKNTPVAGVRAALGLKPSMKGLATGQVQAEGTVEKLSGRGHIAIDKGELGGIPFDSISANVVATESTWKVANLQLVEGRGRASGSMEINPVQRTFSANLHGQDYPLDHIHILNPQLVGTKSVGEVSGVVSFDIKGQGTFDNARVHSTLGITDLAWKGQSLGSVHGEAEWQGRQIRLQVKGGGGKAGNFQISGNMETQGNWPLHLAGNYTDFRADPWIQEFSSHAMGAEIIASGSFSVNGPFKEKNQLVGSSQIDRLQMTFPAMQLTNQGPVVVNYAKRNLKFNQFRLQGPATNFVAGGSIHFGHPPSIDLMAKGSAAATLLRLVASGIQATGESDLEVRLTGTLADPQLSGTIEVKDVGLGYNNFPIRLSTLNGTLKLQGERAVVSSLKGTIGGGAVTFTGFVTLRGDHRYRLQSELSQVRVRYPSDFTSVLDGRLLLAGTPTQGQLSGDISVRNIFANESLNLVDFMSRSSKLFGAPSVGPPSSFTSNISLNVHLASLRPVRLETRNLRLVSDIDLRLQGTLANPVAVGTIYLRSGSAVFRGNRYTLTRGDVSMTNPFQTEPVIDMQVDTRIDKYDLTLEVSGPPNQIHFSYRSDPPLPTEDILSLLAFGYSKRLEEFAPQATSPFSSAGASALLSQALSSQVSGRIQRLFGVSRIKLSPTTGEVGMLGGPVLTVEQQLSPDLTLTYQTSTANSLYRVIEFNWTVNPRMSVRGFRDQNGIFGLELKFRKRFK